MDGRRGDPEELRGTATKELLILGTDVSPWISSYSPSAPPARVNGITLFPG